MFFLVKKTFYTKERSFFIKNLTYLVVAELDKLKVQVTSEEISNKIKNYLEKDKKICDFYRLTNNALYIGDINSGEFDYVLYFNDKKQSRAKKSKPRHRSLEGVKIAIDPGHFGGDLAELEERYIDIPGQETEDDRPIKFDEGTLTYLTAMELKSYLEAEGAVVFCTRDGIGKGAIGQDFYKWLQENLHLAQENNTLSKVFRRYYNQEDLILRAANINAFKPDITVIVHYNVHLTQTEKDQKKMDHRDQL